MTQKSAPNILLCALLCCVPVGAAMAQVFKWVDEKGVTHYGERPPQGQKAQPVDTNPSTTTPSPGSTSSRGGEDWREKNLEFQKRRIQREQQAEREQREAKNRQTRCHVARDDFRRMESARRPYRLNDQGERVDLDDAEHKLSIERARRNVERSCS